MDLMIVGGGWRVRRVEGRCLGVLRKEEEEGGARPSEN